MKENSDDLCLCVRCGQPVENNRDRYDVFEHMHWLCFHLEYEHSGDPDEPCDDIACPWWHIQVFRQKLEELGYDPGEVLWEATKLRWNI